MGGMSLACINLADFGTGDAAMKAVPSSLILETIADVMTEGLRALEAEPAFEPGADAYSAASSVSAPPRSTETSRLTPFSIIVTP